jgi:hypothetical protein
MTPPPSPCDHCPHPRARRGGGSKAPPPPPPPCAVPVMLRRGGLLHGSLQDMVVRSMINAARCSVLLSPSGGVLAGTTQYLAAHRVVGCRGGWRQAAKSGVGAGARVSRHGRRRRCAGWNMPASLPARHRESQTRTSAGWRHGYATAGASRA